MLIGNSAGIIEVQKLIKRVSISDCNVLILGETGTGKELVAQLIHQQSNRRTSNISHINCSALPDTLIESELFGHAKGAFTGACTARQGKIRYANGGTVFLDEIADMSLTAQAKILRALESSEVQEVGADKTYTVDVRWVAATNKKLTDCVKQKNFREDLFYRLNVAEITLPPLRERREDIALLINHFIGIFNKRYHKSVTGVDDDSLSILLSYHWPGNIRELRNAIEFSYISVIGKIIHANHLPENIRSIKRKYTYSSDDNFKIEAREKDIILEVLSNTHWNKSKAAEKLKWSRMTLYRKMKKHQIQEA
ncbi:MAG: sigma-54 dependent transcriptional regulator [Gammaproteobacteria bacterium]|nr:sigma-54 dependent transcriptional regulator [Gammaproteobacteria bacterium]MCW8987367.1 sigma-54 dependent transcriptional regulator [Gammaproteobacteria bacterium]MCW9031155.1 sigma-54 dependent transcriptional regulator [Gammaproteobacteria bacterium]